MEYHNFSAGPALIPERVMIELQEDLSDWVASGLSVMEISHRSPEFISIAESLKSRLRRIMSLPDNYQVLLLPGGAQLQFAGIPMNLAGHNQKVDYAITGHWSRLAAKEAERYASVNAVVDMYSSDCAVISPANTWRCQPDAAYLYYTDNETVNGLEFHSVPDVFSSDLVCDMSSNFLSRPFDIERFGLVYACSQKNLGPAGVTVIIVRDDLLKREAMPITPSVMSYAIQYEKDSMKNTPVTFSWYMVDKVLAWIEQSGGLSEMDRLAKARSDRLYQFIDNSTFYLNSVDVQYRSRLNVVFRLANESKNKRFLEEANKAGLKFLKGHASVGGMRASLYNAMPMASVEKLIEFMYQFELSD